MELIRFQFGNNWYFSKSNISRNEGNNVTQIQFNVQYNIRQLNYLNPKSTAKYYIQVSCTPKKSFIRTNELNNVSVNHALFSCKIQDISFILRESDLQDKIYKMNMYSLSLISVEINWLHFINSSSYPFFTRSNLRNQNPYKASEHHEWCH